MSRDDVDERIRVFFRDRAEACTERLLSYLLDVASQQVAATAVDNEIEGRLRAHAQEVRRSNPRLLDLSQPQPQGPGWEAHVRHGWVPARLMSAPSPDRPGYPPRCDARDLKDDEKLTLLALRLDARLPSVSPFRQVEERLIEISPGAAFALGRPGLDRDSGERDAVAFRAAAMLSLARNDDRGEPDDLTATAWLEELENAIPSEPAPVATKREESTASTAASAISRRAYLRLDDLLARLTSIRQRGATLDPRELLSPRLLAVGNSSDAQNAADDLAKLGWKEDSQKLLIAAVGASKAAFRLAQALAADAGLSPQQIHALREDMLRFLDQLIELVQRLKWAFTEGSPPSMAPSRLDQQQVRPAVDPHGSEITAAPKKRRGRLRKSESEAVKAFLFAFVQDHPTFRYEFAQLAEKFEVSESTVRRWIAEEYEKYQQYLSSKKDE